MPRSASFVLLDFDGDLGEAPESFDAGTADSEVLGLFIGFAELSLAGERSAAFRGGSVREALGRVRFFERRSFSTGTSMSSSPSSYWTCKYSLPSFSCTPTTTPLNQRCFPPCVVQRPSTGSPAAKASLVWSSVEADGRQSPSRWVPSDPLPFRERPTALCCDIEYIAIPAARTSPRSHNLFRISSPPKTRATTRSLRLLRRMLSEASEPVSARSSGVRSAVASSQSVSSILTSRSRCPDGAVPFASQRCLWTVTSLSN
mmetsp:Transcript_6829/g.26371  ORF Transcript_6829/g.26371 Transcript_6829/m.26371 type:complete len:259 (+) Transcript_6829:2621-3397(+)|eukprot:scaffold264_cov317-Pinguiococcus_pyrenoidosus.AAC.31